MPILGHALVGWATAVWVTPTSKAPRHRAIESLWVPVTVTVAYLPDIIAVVLALAGVQRARMIGHSVFLAALASAMLAWIGTTIARCSVNQLYRASTQVMAASACSTPLA